MAVAIFFAFGALFDEANAGETLTVQSSGVDVLIQVELANTVRKKQTGLMHRTWLDPLGGMLFEFKKGQLVAMWMKNTLISLDMIFADQNGRIVYIKEQAQPGDLSIVSTTKPALAVLEVNGGFVSKYKIKVGDQLIHALFEK